jgi:hypothetical protein
LFNLLGEFQRAAAVPGYLFPATAPWDPKSPLPAIATQAATASEI